MYYKDFEENILINLTSFINLADANNYDSQNIELYCRDEENNLYDIRDIKIAKKNNKPFLIISIYKK